MSRARPGNTKPFDGKVRPEQERRGAVGKQHKAPVDKGIDNCGGCTGRWLNYERIGLYFLG